MGEESAAEVELSRRLVAEGRDPLEYLIDLQAGLQVRLRPAIDEMADRLGVDRTFWYLREHSTMLAIEAGEVHECLDWKAHKSRFGLPITAEQRGKMIGETVDCLAFVLNLFLALGVTRTTEIAHHFELKTGISHGRQDSGY